MLFINESMEAVVDKLTKLRTLVDIGVGRISRFQVGESNEGSKTRPPSRCFSLHSNVPRGFDHIVECISKLLREALSDAKLIDFIDGPG